MKLFRSHPLKKKRKSAEEWLQLANKVYHYRRDLLSESELDNLKKRTAELETIFKKKEQVSEKDYDEAIAALEKVLKRIGGVFYPRSWVTENVEMVLVAAILALGVRAFFFQPFKIPTNSMYPTYNGMTHVVHHAGNPEPSLAEKVVRFLMFGATTYKVIAPADGELFISTRVTSAQRRDFLIFPSTKAVMTFAVGSGTATLLVPADFAGQLRKIIEEMQQQDGRRWVEDIVPGVGSCLKTGRWYQRGETMLSFEILSGDALFVDRFSYHFVPPKPGDPFVFRTDGIPGMDAGDRGKYFIKRLAGVPGDRLEIREPALFRNGEKATGSVGFEKNNLREGEYDGYFYADRLGNAPYLRKGQVLTVPEHMYFALGDNSDESKDSRVWGFVPQDQIVGKAVFIYWPFTPHWGLSR